jgi:hypothetical protein
VQSDIGTREHIVLYDDRYFGETES